MHPDTFVSLRRKLRRANANMALLSTKKKHVFATP
jgi:hypothetical protein